MKLLFRRKLAKKFPIRYRGVMLIAVGMIIGISAQSFGQNNTPPPKQPRQQNRTSIQSEIKSGNQNNIKFPDEYSELDNNSSIKKSNDKTIAKILERSKQKYLQALKLIQKKDTVNAARFFEHAIEILNKAASYQGIEENEEFTELAQSIIDDYETYIKSVDDLDDQTSMVIMRDRLFQEFEKIQTTPDLTVNDKNHKPIPSLNMPTNLVIPLDSNELVDRTLRIFTEQKSGINFIKTIVAKSGKWFPMMKRIAREEGMPEEIIMISTYESALNPNIVSKAGAVGLWQFMQQTAKDYGMNVRPSIWLDERRDPEKSTRAAMRYLKALKNDFGDWYLAMAAYNAGPGKIRAAMRKVPPTDSLNYWTVMKALNYRETKGYVPMFIAITKIMYNLEKFGFDKNSVVFDPEYKYDIFTLNEPVALSAIAKAAKASEKEIKELNPELINGATPADLAEYKVKIPYGSLSTFNQGFALLTPEEKIPWIYYSTGKKESLASVAQKYGISIRQLADANQGVSQSGRLPRGTKLKIPVGKRDELCDDNSKYCADQTNNNVATVNKNLNSTNNKADNSLRNNSLNAAQQQTKLTDTPTKKNNYDAKKYKNYPTHKVAKGESIYNIAVKYGMRPTELKEINGLPADDDRLFEGQILRVNPSGDFKVNIPESSNNSSESNTQSKFIYHKVRKNESLEKIAQKYGTTVEDIKSNNRIGKHIKVGQTLKIASNNSVNTQNITKNNSNVSGKSSKAKTVPVAAPTVHIVKRGENLAKIAEMYNISLNDLSKLNNIKKGKITVGQELKLTGNIAQANPKFSKNNPAGKAIKHTVKKGETIESIANKYNVSQDDIKEWNKKKIKGDIIVANTDLTIKANATQSASNTKLAKSGGKSKKNQKYYVIKKGDTLEKIARKFDMTVDDLAKTNNKSKEKALRIGEKIKVE